MREQRKEGESEAHDALQLKPQFHNDRKDDFILFMGDREHNLIGDFFRRILREEPLLQGVSETTTINEISILDLLLRAPLNMPVLMNWGRMVVTWI